VSKTVALCLDDGHGTETLGKQSPITGMKENEFNRAVVKYLTEYCKVNNILYLETAQGDADIPLAERTAAANKWYEQLKKQYADLYCLFISCHANAGGGTGCEIWVHSKAAASTVAAAQSVVVEIAKLGMKNRGVKKGYAGDPNADYYVNSATDMASMLIEYAFMDNPGDAQLLLSEDFRKNCAKATIKGVLSYLNLAFIDISETPDSGSGSEDILRLKAENEKLKAENLKLSAEKQSLSNILSQKENIISQVKALVE